LPVSIVDMLAHGHGDVKYVHYNLDLFVHDSNYIVGSFARLFQDLKMSPRPSSHRLFDGSRLSPIFEAEWRGNVQPHRASHLNVQMNNAGNNKNWFVFCF
jgi:hypothetical protein